MSNRDNELIARFMGARESDGKYQIECSNPESYEYGAVFWYEPENMFYSKSWDWLMPVCGKICKTTPYNSYLAIETISVFADIKDVYKAVVEFIEWYNLNTKTPLSIIKDNG